MFSYFFNENKNIDFNYDKYFDIIFCESLYVFEWLFGQDVFGNYRDFKEIKEQNHYTSVKNKIGKLNELNNKYIDKTLTEIDLILFEIRLLEPYYLYELDNKLSNCYDQNSIYKFYNVILNCERNEMNTTVEYLIEKYNNQEYKENDGKYFLIIKNEKDAIELRIEFDELEILLHNKSKEKSEYNWNILERLNQV